ncbi:hypothetical protein Skr01_03400 [Sphaerisporangium krabiense]|uniref:Uncharacterized protein n=1 Tax=Sphaerisporangium krabiense TaxID=763782 RepID=A0A7W8Z7F8_9ACTN|nr:hypothetical protein [Sphaerisporangium krabiense]MBB5628904.1 hypothetical protein [Sphaerisporangium krabiense]GII60255.1 hypothetical protein Skr01_03400 [Sphaerisporangium krabiense]
MRPPSLADALAGSSPLLMSLVPMCSSTTVGRYVAIAESVMAASWEIVQVGRPSWASGAGPERCEPTNATPAPSSRSSLSRVGR